MPAFTPAIIFSVKLPEFEATVSGYDPLKEAVYGKAYSTLTTLQFHRQVLKLAREKAETQIKAAAAAMYKGEQP